MNIDGLALFVKQKVKLTYSQLSSVLSQPRVNSLAFYGLVLLVFTLVFFLNYLLPYYADDWCYTFRYDVPTEKVRGLKDVFYSQYNHYLAWGGRTVAHSILQILLIFDKWISDIVNSIVFTIYLAVIYKISRLKATSKTNLGLFVFIFALVWFLQPLGSTALWLTGSCNYLWTTTFVLCFMYPYCKYYLTDIQSYPRLKLVFMPIAGVLAGWSNENLAVSLLSFIILFIAVLKYDKKKIPTWAISGAAGALVGILFLILAPGNFVRFDNEVMSNSAVQDPFFVQILKRIYIVAYSYFFKGGLLATGAYLITYLFSHYFGQDNKKVFVVSFSFLLIAAAGALSMFMVPVFPDRAWFGPFTFVIVAASLLFANILYSSPFLINLRNVLLIFGFLVILKQYHFAIKDTQSISAVFEQRKEEVLQQKDEGKRDIVIATELPQLSTNFVYVSEMSKDSSNWVNQVYAKYYDVHSIRKR